MSEARRAIPNLSFNGENVSTKLRGYLKNVTYEDIASGSSDTISILLQNTDMKWIDKWHPTKGDKISGSIEFKDWEKDGKSITLNCGTFVCDQIKFSGNPLEAYIGGISHPANDSFKVRDRTKTWRNVTVKKIAAEIAGRYNLKLSYSGPSIIIDTVEQSEKNDSAFLYDTCQRYGLSMKVFGGKIVIYDQTAQEKQKAIATIKRNSFVEDEWEYTESLCGTYTGARISYKSGNDNKEISAYLGFKSEDAPGSRILKITDTAENQKAAYYMAAAKVNKANEEAATMTGRIWANPKICAGTCVTVSGFGKADGKYFVDKVATEIGGSGTMQNIEMHKCQKRLTYTPKPRKPEPAKAANIQTTKKTYKVGDIVNFRGGTHYVSSYPGARGSAARAGKAKITHAPNCAGNGKAHPWHLIHVDNSSNVYGWVDEGSFS